MILLIVIFFYLLILFGDFGFSCLLNWAFGDGFGFIVEMLIEWGLFYLGNFFFLVLVNLGFTLRIGNGEWD